MKRMYVLVMVIFLTDEVLAQRKSLKEDVKTSWYAEFDKYEDYKTCDTFILRKFNEIKNYKKKFYVMYDHKKGNKFVTTYLNNVPEGINDISFATYEKWKIKRATDELYYLTMINFDSNFNLIFRAIPFYNISDDIDHVVLLRVRR